MPKLQIHVGLAQIQREAQLVVDKVSYILLTRWQDLLKFHRNNN